MAIIKSWHAFKNIMDYIKLFIVLFQQPTNQLLLDDNANGKWLVDVKKVTILKFWDKGSKNCNQQSFSWTYINLNDRDVMLV